MQRQVITAVKSANRMKHSPLNESDRIAHHDRPLLNGAHPKDSRLRLGDDWGGEERAAHAMVGDREGPALHLVERQLVVHAHELE